MNKLTSAGAGAGVPLLAIHDVGKTYGYSTVLSDVSLSIARGEVVGLIGANGAGKSTLIKCITGTVAASTGTMVMDGAPIAVQTPDDGLTYGLCAVQQEVNLLENHSVTENILLGRFESRTGFVSKSRLRARAIALLRRVKLDHLDPDAMAGKLTPTSKRLVMIASVLARDPRLIILDEPTAALPPEESKTVLALVRELSSQGVAVIYVSHRLHEVERLCSRVVALRNGRQSGILEGAEVSRAEMLKLIGGGREPSTLLLSEDHVHQTARPSGDVVLQASDICGRRVRDASFVARRGEILGVAGLAGSGRSELLRLIYGLQPLTGGSMEYQGKPLKEPLRGRISHGMGYVTELRASNVLPGISVARNVTCNSVDAHRRFGLFADGAWETRRTMDIAKEVSLVGKPADPIDSLSGGNQQKVLISRWLVKDTGLLLLDEPTAGVDLVSRAEIHELLRQITAQGKTVIVASVETDELTTICDRVMVMVEGEIRETLTPPFAEDELIKALFSHRVVDPGTEALPSIPA